MGPTWSFGGLTQIRWIFLQVPHRLGDILVAQYRLGGILVGPMQICFGFGGSKHTGLIFGGFCLDQVNIWYVSHRLGGIQVGPTQIGQMFVGPMQIEFNFGGSQVGWDQLWWIPNGGLSFLGPMYIGFYDDFVDWVFFGGSHIEQVEFCGFHVDCLTVRMRLWPWTLLGFISQTLKPFS